jgi:hypothetical protein
MGFEQGVLLFGATDPGGCSMLRFSAAGKCGVLVATL